MHLAQINIAHTKFLQDESRYATSIDVFDDPNIIINMSVWKDQDSLKNFMFRTEHLDFLITTEWS